MQVAQEKAQEQRQCLRSRRRALLAAWAQLSRAFVLRAGAAAAEAAAAHEAQLELAGSRQRQLEICAHLKAKVRLVINPPPNLHLTDAFRMKFFTLAQICFQVNNGYLSFWGFLRMLFKT